MQKVDAYLIGAVQTPTVGNDDCFTICVSRSSGDDQTDFLLQELLQLSPFDCNEDYLNDRHSLVFTSMICQL